MVLLWNGNRKPLVGQRSRVATRSGLNLIENEKLRRQYAENEARYSHGDY